MQHREAHTYLLSKSRKGVQGAMAFPHRKLAHISLQASNTEANMQGDWAGQLLPQELLAQTSRKPHGLLLPPKHKEPM